MDNQRKLRVFEGFSGYGSQSLQLSAMGIPHEVVGTSEVDTYAIVAYSATHDSFRDIKGIGHDEMRQYLQDRNIGYDLKKGMYPNLTKKRLESTYSAALGQNCYGDITLLEVEELPDMDLFTYSFPCQDISVAGLGKGLTEDSNTRSSLLWECRKVIKGKKPKFLMMENVKNLLSEKHKKDFDKWLEWLELQGYNNYYKVINAKNCGVPQNRERVFLVSILKDIDDGSFHFEDDFDSGLRLKDILDREVDSKFYIKTEKAKKLLESLHGKEIIPSGINIPRQGEVFDKNVNVASCLLARDYKGLGNQSMMAVVEPVIVASRGRNTSGDKSYTQELEFNGTENTNTITTVQKDNLVLSPKRLGGLFDKDGKKRQAGAVWDKECLAPTIDTCQGGYREPIVVVDKEDTHSLKFIGGLDSNKRIEDGKNLSRNYKEGYRVYDVDGIATCQKSSGGGLGGCTGLYQTEYSIRRLTPRECLRLMGLTEDEINKIQDSGISDTQQYKLAGNSIVKPCMAFLKNLPLHKLKQSN